MTSTAQGGKKLTTLDVMPSIVASSVVCSAAIVEFTIPQVVKLSQATAQALPPAPLFPHRAAMFARFIGPQTALTVLQFGLVRELREVIDKAVGWSPVNLSIAYGVASVPLITAKYNLIIAGVYKYNGVSNPQAPSAESYLQTCTRFWRRNIQPGLLWSYLRDSGSVGGGVVLGPYVSARLAALTSDGREPSAPSALHRFGGGLISGCCTGLATQWLHNTALTAGRMAEAAGKPPGTFECLQQTFAEHGSRTLYLNFQWRVAIIAFWTATLTLAGPFAQ